MLIVVQSSGSLDSNAYLFVYLAIVYLGHENVAMLLMLHVVQEQKLISYVLFIK